MDVSDLSLETPSVAAPAAPGSMVDRYLLKRRLGSSAGLHPVYEATDPSGDPVAVTLFRLPRHNRRLARRFNRAVRARASLFHPGMLRVLSSGHTSAGLYLATELPPARTLADLLSERGSLKPRAAVTALAPVAGALDAALTQGILPGDLSPEVILVAADDGRGLLGDIGIASALLERNLQYLLTHADFASPEEIRLEPADARSTVYSLTCVLYECLTGSPPFNTGTPIVTLYAHGAEQPPRASDRNRALPTPIDAVLERGMEKDPESRFASPGELMSAAATALGLELPAEGGDAVYRHDGGPVPSGISEPPAKQRPESDRSALGGGTPLRSRRPPPRKLRRASSE